MATGYIYNGFGQYEENNGEKGKWLSFSGVNFWLPFKKVTPIPNWTFRILDHDKSTPEGGMGTERDITYQSVVINGQRVVEELVMNQDPFKNSDLGMIPIEGKLTGKVLEVYAGVDGDGRALFLEVPEKAPTASEIELAERNAKAFKEAVIGEFFQSKRERITGGRGRLRPEGMVRVFMEELNVEDVDDVTTHQKPVGGVDLELIKAVAQMMQESQEINAQKLMEAVATVRKGEKAQLAKARSRSIGLAEHARKYDEAQAQKEQKGEDNG